MSAEERLSDYIEYMENLIPIMTELNKLDMDTILINARQQDITSIQLSAVALREFKENVAYYIDYYNEKITGLRDYVRGVREKEMEVQNREYKAGV